MLADQVCQREPISAADGNVQQDNCNVISQEMLERFAGGVSLDQIRAEFGKCVLMAQELPGSSATRRMLTRSTIAQHLHVIQPVTWASVEVGNIFAEIQCQQIRDWDQSGDHLVQRMNAPLNTLSKGRHVGLDFYDLLTAGPHWPLR